MRRFLLATALVAVLVPATLASAAYRSALIPEMAAARHGLTKAWSAQITLDSGRSRVESVTLHDDMVYVQTDQAVLHALDAKTGATVWQKQIGKAHHPTLPPGFNEDLMGVINASSLYIINRYNGDILHELSIDAAPGAGPALSHRWAFVPCINGLVLGYRIEPLVDPLEELGKINQNMSPADQALAEQRRRENIRLSHEFRTPIACQSRGRAMVQPVVLRREENDEYIAWPTDQGYLNIGWVGEARNADQLSVKHCAETDEEISARPTYIPADPDVVEDSGVIIGVSQDGAVQARLEKGGDLLWRFPASEPIVQPAVAIGQQLYVTTLLGGMFCLNVKDGSELWWAPHVFQFVAAGQDRVYATDKAGNLVVLSAKTGAQLDSIDTTASPIKMINPATDRIFLATDTGLIQCLHEVELTKPLRHAAAREKFDPEGRRAPRQQPVEAGPGPAVPGPGVDPFGGGGGAGADPFGGGGAGAGADPFGGGGGGAGADPFGGGGGAGADPFGGGGAGADPFGGGGGGEDNGGGGGGADPFGGGADDPFG